MGCKVVLGGRVVAGTGQGTVGAGTVYGMVGAGAAGCVRSGTEIRQHYLSITDVRNSSSQMTNSLPTRCVTARQNWPHLHRPRGEHRGAALTMGCTH